MAAPYGPARQRRRGSAIGPLILIFIGGVFLLQNAGILPPTVWGSLWRLWPLVLVLVGLELVFGARAGWLVAVLGLFAIVGALVFVSGMNFGLNTPGASPAATRTFTTDLGGASQAAVTVRFGAGRLDIGSLADGAAGQLASMTYSGPSDLAVEPSYNVVGNTGRLDYQLGGGHNAAGMPFLNRDSGDTPNMAIDLSPNTAISTLQVQSGAADARIDLSGLRVNNLDMALGAAATRLRLPDAGQTSAHITGGASSINIEVPPGVAARIRHRGGLSTVNVDQSRFPRVGEDQYQSPDWDTNPNRVDLNLETGVTNVQVS